MYSFHFLRELWLSKLTYIDGLWCYRRLLYLHVNWIIQKNHEKHRRISADNKLEKPSYEFCCHILLFRCISLPCHGTISVLQKKKSYSKISLSLDSVSSVFNIFHSLTLQRRHNGHDSVSNHQPHVCLLNRLFKRRSKKISKLRVTGLCAENSPVNSPHKWPVTRKMFPFDDVIMENFGARLGGTAIETHCTAGWGLCENLR